VRAYSTSEIPAARAAACASVATRYFAVNVLVVMRHLYFRWLAA